MMSDCERCWNTPCTCRDGHGWRRFKVEQLLAMRNSLEAAIHHSTQPATMATPLRPLLLAGASHAQALGLRALADHLRGIASTLGGDTIGSVETLCERDAQHIAAVLGGAMLVLADPPPNVPRDQVALLCEYLRGAISLANAR